MSLEPTSYEEVPYESKPHYPMHADCIGTLGLLFGMNPAPVNRCRVLELGCAQGMNLICLAEAWPDSEFIGIDLSPSQIEAGQRLVKRAGLKNITLKAASILDVDESWGKFDYITSHGVFSWVPPVVQEKILSICRALLNPQGIAFISYNAYPGWHLRNIVRDLMRFYGRSFHEPQQRIDQARAVLQFMAKASPDPQSPYGRILAKEAEKLGMAPDSYVYHEHLEDVNTPFYFHEFIERTSRHQLQYLSEAWQHTMLDELSEEAGETLQNISQNLIQLEQFSDFLTNRTFRRTLLCHQEIAVHREPAEETISSLYVSLISIPTSEEPLDARSDKPFHFKMDHGASAVVTYPIAKAALARLNAIWPQAMRVEDLFQLALADLNDPQADVAQLRALLCALLLRGHLAHFVALHRQPLLFCDKVGPQPEVNVLARILAPGSTLVPSRRHKLVPLSPADRLLIPLVNGKRSVRELAPALIAARNALSSADAAALELPSADDTLQTWIADALQHYARQALLVK